MTPTGRIAAALAIWPGREADVAREVGVSKCLLRMWSGKPGGRHRAPSEGDAERVEESVSRLLRDRLVRLTSHAWENRPPEPDQEPVSEGETVERLEGSIIVVMQEREQKREWRAVFAGVGGVFEGAGPTPELARADLADGIREDARNASAALAAIESDGWVRDP